MRRTCIAIALTLLASPLGAQETSPQQPTAARGFRWYLAPTAQITRVNQETALLTGLEFGWMKSPRLTLGLASYRLGSQVTADRPDAAGARDAEFFYSGITASYAVYQRAGLRLAPSLLLGGAEAHWREDYWDGMPDPDHRDDEHTTSLVLEPGVSVEATLLPWLRVDVAGGYRFVAGGKSNVMRQADMRGFSATLGLRLGSF